MSFQFLCPKCKKPQHCGCSACKSRHKHKITQEYTPDGEGAKCGHCGHTMHLDGWLDEELKQYKEYNKNETKTK